MVPGAKTRSGITRLRIVSLLATLSQLVLVFKTSIDQPLEPSTGAHRIPDRHAETRAFRGKQLNGIALAESRRVQADAGAADRRISAPPEPQIQIDGVKQVRQQEAGRCTHH